MKTTKSPECRENIEECGRELIQHSKEAELDNKLIAIGSLIVIIAGAFTCLASVTIGLGLIAAGLIIFLLKRLNEKIAFLKTRRQKVSVGNTAGS